MTLFGGRQFPFANLDRTYIRGAAVVRIEPILSQFCCAASVSYAYFPALIALNDPEKIVRNNILVVGAYGLIGYGVSSKLIAGGCKVTGLGRNAQLGRRVLPGVPWIEADVQTLCDEWSWHAILEDFSTVVNCSGALQDSPDDDLEAIHHLSVKALAQACAAKDIALIQISAVGATPDASTRFLATKGRGDAAIRAVAGKWHIFRPGLVLAQNAYGGTTMLRMLAAFPICQPIASPEAEVQTVALDYVAEVVLAATQAKIAYGVDVDLVESKAHTLRDLVADMRGWLGFSPAKLELAAPNLVVRVVSKTADSLAWLGWRSPLRSTAIKVLTEGVLGKPADLSQFGLPPAPTLKQTLKGLRVGGQDRLFARIALLFPFILLCLSLFWLTSGIVGIVRLNEAAQVLREVGWSAGLAMTSVYFWSLVDIIIGIGFAFRRYAYSACWAAVGVSVLYLVASTFTVPFLWLDPLGPLVKVVPSIALALVARAALDTR